MPCRIVFAKLEESPGLQSASEEDLQPNFREKVEIAVALLKKGRTEGVDNVPTEIVQAGGETFDRCFDKDL